MAPALGENFDTAPAPTLLHTKPTFLKQAKVNKRFGPFFPDFLAK
jgi:hypothetical protein